jgi:hypothetical protein
MRLNQVLAAAALAVMSTTASAAVISFTGNVTELPFQSQISNAFPRSDTTAYVYQERTTILNAPLTVAGTAGNVVLGIGTRVTSYLLFLNQQPPSPSGSPVVQAGTVTFSNAILGVIRSTTAMNATDAILGAIGTNYTFGGGGNNRGLENGDTLTFAGSTATFNFSVTEPGDWTRVVTAAVPVPASAGLLAFGLLGLFGLRRRGAAAV